MSAAAAAAATFYAGYASFRQCAAADKCGQRAMPMPIAGAAAVSAVFRCVATRCFFARCYAAETATAMPVTIHTCQATRYMSRGCYA